MNGDVDGSGGIRLTDAVHLLNYLFRGPRELPAVCTECEGASALPATGQTSCYNSDGTEGSCDGGFCAGQDASYHVGCPMKNRFVDNGDGTVTDTCTSLMWLKEPGDTNGDGERDDKDFVAWCDGLRYCDKLSFAGHSDWRLPDIRELQSIVDYGRFNPANDPVFGHPRFVGPLLYWSSTSSSAKHDRAWEVSFATGGVGHVLKDSRLAHVRAVRMESAVKAMGANRANRGGGAGCVSINGDVDGNGAVQLTDAVQILDHLFRGPRTLLPLCLDCENASGLPATGQETCYDVGGTEIPCDSGPCHGQDGFHQSGCRSRTRFVDNGDGTVTDTCTRLMWLKDAIDTNNDGRVDDRDAVTWCQALVHCESLSFAGHDDWRLPNNREIQSIVDYERLDPALHPIFRGRAGYWSSTTDADTPELAWVVSFFEGAIAPSLKSNDNRVRAVRAGR